MGDPITFLASFPPIQGAIKVTGNGDGMRIQLDIPEMEMGNAARLLLLRQCTLKVTIEEGQNNTNVPGTVKRSAAKKRIG